MIDYNDIYWICPKCGAGYFSPQNSKPNGDGHCSNCPGTLVETKYKCGNVSFLPGYEQISHERLYTEYVYNNEQYDPELIEKWNQIVSRGNNSTLNQLNLKQSNAPKCPTCGSTNIKKISTFNRAISIGTLGLLSGKIGKNYECLNCKSKW